MIEWMVTSSILIAAVLLIRLCLKGRISAGIRYGLWLVVLIRLLFPMNFLDSRMSVLNLLPERGAVVEEDLAANDEAKADDWTEGGLPLAGVEIAQSNTYGTAWNDVPLPTPSGMPTVPQQSLQLPKLQPEDNNREYTGEWLMVLAQTIAWNVWWLGAVVCGLGMLWSNLRFRRNLRRGATLLSVGQPPVYVSEHVRNPFMFGVLCPVIFVPESVTKEKEVFAFVLSHERTHYAHKDHIWAFLRAVCLCVHWYNPLVWIAADRSRQDAELACDEAVLRRLEADRRTAYGKALIALSVERGRGEFSDNLRLATTMSGSKKQLKERIQMVAKSPKMAVGTAVFAALLVVIVSVATFTGKSEAAYDEQYEEEKVVTIGYDTEEDAYQTEEVDRIGDYQAEMVLIDLDTVDRQYYLEVDGREISGDSNYQIERVNLYYTEHGQEERYLCGGCELADALLSYWGADEQVVIHSDMDGGLLVEDLNGDGYEEFGISYNGNPGMWYVWQWVPEADNPEQGTFVFAGLVRKGQAEDGTQQVSYSNSRYTADSAVFTTTYATPGTTDGVVELDRVDWSIHKYLPDGGEEVRETTLHFWGGTYLGWSQMADGVYTYQDHEKQYQRVDVAYLAGLAIEELYETTGYWVDECYFDAATGGTFWFSNSAEDLLHGRTFYSRCYGVAGVIPHISFTTREMVWFSNITQNMDVSQGFVPENYQEKSDEEMLVWFLEHTPIGNGETVKEVTLRYEDTYTAETKEGHFYEMNYSHNQYSAPTSINITGPYPSYPEH